MLARSGDATEPCPVPCSLTVTTPSSRIPALSHFRIRRMTRGSLTRCPRKRTSHSWLTESKKDRMSASRTWFTFLLLIPTHRASSASCGPRLGRNPCVQIFEPGLELCLVVPPCQPVHAGCSVSLEREERQPEQVDADMVEERGEPFLLPLLCDLPYAAQRLGHTFPVLCPARAALTRIPLQPFRGNRLPPKGRVQRIKIRGQRFQRGVGDLADNPQRMIGPNPLFHIDIAE